MVGLGFVFLFRNCPLRSLGFISDDILNLKAIEEVILKNSLPKSQHKANKNFTVKTTFHLNSSSQTVLKNTASVPRSLVRGGTPVSHTAIRQRLLLGLFPLGLGEKKTYLVK